MSSSDNPVFKLLHDLLTLALRSDDNIIVPQHIAFVIKEYDKDERIYHIEESGNKYILWHTKAWKSNVDYVEYLRAKSLQDKILFDNMKWNLTLISNKLRKLTGVSDTKQLEYMSAEMLRRSGKMLEGIMGIELKEPWYTGVYEIMKFRG